MSNPLNDDLRGRLLRLLEEPVAAAQRRECSEFDRLVGSRANHLLLFGAGNLGKRALAILRKSGQEPLAFMDNNPALWGTRIDGVEVLQPSKAARQFNPNDVAVLVTIWCGEATDKMSDRIEPIRRLGFNHIALFGHLAWKYPETFLPHYSLDLPSRVLQAADRILKAFDLFQDRRSREIFVSHIDWRLHLNYDSLPPPANEAIYFNSRLIRPLNKEFLIDGGAFTGDTINEFLGTFGREGFMRILSFEPDPCNFIGLKKYIETLPADLQSKIIPMPCALAAESNFITVETSGGPSSRVGYGNHTVACQMIDDFSDVEGAPTFIKLDIEGYEPQALRGAAKVLHQSHPVVAVCVYHMQDHLWEIPLEIASHVSDYHYTLVPHLSDGWDLVLYAVPPHRLPN